ncbi:hypothetical protein G6F23_013641 [Rhizopus arrhizus]|nr:hypothetical protein G6F23_013641 [Rhizopus arrhizus]
MEPTADGIPVEVYCFTAVTAWVEYERIQGDIFDHLLAILPELGLRLYQQPSGADIGAMKDWSYMDVYGSEYITRNWETLKRIRKPVIAAVGGYALGGGCELAMMCDIIIAADTAKFGQPEIKLGVIPGAGGTQRLPRAVGKAKAMDLALTARMMGAEEAERAGLVSRVVPADKLMEEALDAATVIASMSLPSVMMAKECVNRAFESSLNEGLLFERRVFHSLFATEDQKEGMAAFTEKRKPDFKHR